MSELAKLTLIVGSVLLLLHGTCFLFPMRARSIAASFPRNAWIGWCFTALAFLWAAWLVYNMPLGGFEKFKPWLFVITPVLICLVSIYMQELLAVRALGGLLLLIPAPIFDAARFSDESLSVIMTVVAYIIVIKGILLVLSPYLFRKTSERMMKTNGTTRTIGAIGIAFDVFLLLLALTVY